MTARTTGTGLNMSIRIADIITRWITWLIAMSWIYLSMAVASDRTATAIVVICTA
jgi:hypothetical protein